MLSRYSYWFAAAVLLLAGLSFDAEAEEAQLAPPAAAAAGAPASNPEMQAILQRLEQQELELRQLRGRIGQLQSEVHLLPPVAEAPINQLPQPPPSGVLRASAVESPSVFELQDRLASLEKRVQQASFEQQTKPASLENLDANDAVKGYEVGSDLKMTASWKNGLNVQSANKDFRVHIGGRAQFDIAMFDNDPALLAPPAVGGIGPQPDSINLRRARLRADGTMYEVFDWVTEIEFNNLVSVPTPNVQAPATTNPAYTDVSLTWTQLPVVGNFRVGNFKEPIGFEHLQSDSFLPFMERSYLQDFVFGPFNGGYTPGLAFLNWTKDLDGTWGIGFFGNNSDNFGYSLGNDYAGTGRISWCPYYDEPSDGRYVVHFGVAGSVRGADEGLERLRVRGDIRSGPPGVLNPIYGDTGSIGATNQEIAAFETAFVLGSLSIVGEYVGTWIENATQPIGPMPIDRGTPFFHGGYIQCGYFLTGEHEVYDRKRGTFDRITPYENAFCVRNCDGHCKGWGAWQVLGRYNALDLNDNGIEGGMLNSFTFGVNWLWNANARMMVNYDFTNRSRVKTVPQGDISALGIRFGYDF